ncbi:MAG: hypothetical protein U5R48_05985 [Gammaproteobacteria bacterium]|nr:hypothetical protein [Gammaproteobacteria bacterium]
MPVQPEAYGRISGPELRPAARSSAQVPLAAGPGPGRMSPVATRVRSAAAALLLLAFGLSTAAGLAAKPAFELEPALTLEPDPPRAGAVLEVVLAEDLLATGRVLRLRDPGADRVLGERTLDATAPGPCASPCPRTCNGW